MLQILVYDQLSPCPYLPGQVARLPMRRPVGMNAADFDHCLEAGDRRLGTLLYRTQCPQCQACEPIRIAIHDFQPHRSQRRTLRKGDALLETRVGPPECTQERVELYNLHKKQRGLDHGEPGLDECGYCEFLVETCTDTIEFSYWYRGELVAVAISDRGSRALNAVYCFFKPNFSQLGLGTYNVLRQVEFCREWNITHLYLGFFIAASPHMSYKSNFLPHERFVAGSWRNYAAAQRSH